jgi:SAM-dependent methyltransferase
MEDLISGTIAGYDRVAHAYADLHAHTPTELATFRRQFARYLPACGRVADLGCGPGNDARWLRERGHDVVGLDLSAGMLAIAAAAGIPVVKADLRRLPFPASTLEGIWSVAALLHIPNEATTQTLRGWWHSLRPAGYLGLSTSLGHHEGWEAMPDTLTGPYSQAGGLRRWYAHREPQAVLQALADAGFEICEQGIRTSHRTWIQIVARRPA